MLSLRKEYRCNGLCERCNKAKYNRKEKYYTCSLIKTFGLKVIAPHPPYNN